MILGAMKGGSRSRRRGKAWCRAGAVLLLKMMMTSLDCPRLSFRKQSIVPSIFCLFIGNERSLEPGGGGGVLPYMGYIGMCRCEGYGFQAVYSSIGYINQSVWV